MHIELRFFRADTASGAHNAVDNALHVNAGRDHDAVADDGRERGVEINAVARFGALGVDGAAGLKKDFSARRDENDVRRRGSRRR